ncbi:pentatricopeptide repeat-containing protein, partial [Tanacetum coccineum]
MVALATPPASPQPEPPNYGRRPPPDGPTSPPAVPSPAERVCSEMQDRNVVSWTSMLMGYLLRGLYDESLKLHLQMQVDGVKPNPFTFATILGALADSGVVVK